MEETVVVGRQDRGSVNTNPVLSLIHIEARVTIEDSPSGIVGKCREYLDLVA